MIYLHEIGVPLLSARLTDLLHGQIASRPADVAEVDEIGTWPHSGQHTAEPANTSS